MQQPKILVAIRKRPLSKKQTSKGETDIIEVKNNDTVIVSELKQKVDLTKYMEETIFNFDYAFNEETRNEEIYELAVRPLVDSAFMGAKVTCFAYGQTGSGKTFTMNGVMQQGIPGLYTLGANDIFDYLASPHFRHLKAKLSFYEIYCGKLYDLLNKRNELKLRQDNKNNINIIGLEEASVHSSEEFIDYLAQGSKERVTSQNSANADSSRSHAILQITLKDGKKVFGKISFIDLAGNQRGADHMDMNKQTRIDGAQINKSLLSLKQCIRALDQGKGHTPFRGSKLTMVLKDSFVGFCRTVMIGNVSPSSASSQNTLNTLRYADRVKQLRKPQEGVSKQEMKAKELMLPRQNKNAIKIMISNDDDAQDIADKRDLARKEHGLQGEGPPKKQVKEDLSARKNSFNNKIGASGKPQNKSTSVTKNNLASSLGHKASLNNNLVTPPQQPQNYAQNRLSNPINPRGRNQSNYRQYQGTSNRQIPYNQSQAPQGMTRYNSSQYGNLASRKQEPMEIETESPYYMQQPQQQTGNRNNQPNRIIGQRQQQPNMMSQSQNVSGNYSNLSMNSHMNNSQYQQQPQSRNPNNYSSNPNNNYNPQYSNPRQQNNFFQNNPIQQQNPRAPYQLPQNWQDMSALVSTSNDPHFTQKVITQMNERLFTQEEDLIRNHSDSLRREIDIIKSEMSQLNEIQIDRSKITSREYVQFMQDSIEEKISLLQELREKMISFTYKLDSVEQIERHGGGGNKNLQIDQQLLDDIN